ncbi:stage II sporulation protein M [Candidatus Woesearchaeota archaeon]|nr:stage II sporulation protein M [Candidatus Woesearchaeota archaeon]MCF7900645.1 stage II sporulation protein M [Candidatus Woesearchaeota archaeon]MCF8013485.1 stage II sporulation protein M [Candidatus Woesearchaeota archaeon]
MVLESIVDPIVAEDKKHRLLWIGGVFVAVAIVLSLMVFEPYASLLIVFLTAIAAVPLMYNIIKYEEAKDLELHTEKAILKQHAKALEAFMFLFIGITIACAIAYVILPTDTTNTAFSTQTETLQEIRGSVTGMSIAQQIVMFEKIFFNNVKVLIFSILFSFVFGAGAIFVLTWNASVIGVAIGNYVKGTLATYADLVGFQKVANYFTTISIGLLRYAIHGIPEILAYFTAALAGGIISVAVIRHDFGTAKFEKVILDTADLLLISVGILFVAAILEVWITPLIFPF